MILKVVRIINQRRRLFERYEKLTHLLTKCENDKKCFEFQSYFWSLLDFKICETLKQIKELTEALKSFGLPTWATKCPKKLMLVYIRNLFKKEV